MRMLIKITRRMHSENASYSAQMLLSTRLLEEQWRPTVFFSGVIWLLNEVSWREGHKSRVKTKSTGKHTDQRGTQYAINDFKLSHNE